MRLTRRDVALVRDVSLSHLLARDQIIALGYFNSISRANGRLLLLIRHGFIRRLDTPFFAQSLYASASLAREVVGERISPLLASRASSPRFVAHALSCTNVRIALQRAGTGEWRFEQQLWRTLSNHESHQLKPDGLFLAKVPVFVEVDMGHVAPSKFRSKLLGYRALALSSQCQALYGFPGFRLLIVTSGSLRARHLRRLVPPDPGFECLIQTFEEVGAKHVTAWS